MIFYDYFAEIGYRLVYLVWSLMITFLTCYHYSLTLIYLFARPFLRSSHSSDGRIHSKGLSDPDCTQSSVLSQNDEIKEIGLEWGLRDNLEIESPIYIDLTGIHKVEGFIFTNLTEGFHTTLKICLFWSLLFMLPVICYQFWCFLIPSWYAFQRTVSIRLIKHSGLFTVLGGASFYYLVLPSILDFLLHFKVNSPLITIQYQGRIEDYVKTSCSLFLIVVLSFQLSVILFSLYQKGCLNPITSRMISRHRKVLGVFGILLLALLLPPEPFSSFIVFSGFFLILEGIIWVGFFEGIKG